MASASCGYGFPLFTRLPLRVVFSGTQLPTRSVLEHSLTTLREIEGISQKMLTKTLRRLEWYGLIRREAYPVIPPRVGYSLTRLGESLIRILAQLCAWTEVHIEEVEATRRDYDAREGI